MSDHAKPIYVEIFIRGGMEDLWRLTQTPQVHQRWDLRFSEIQYLPKNSEAEPQKFLYSTRIGFGLAIRGRGESIGTREGHDGQRSSALKFWSNDPKSLIEEGSGYWKYVPAEDGVRFLTLYDYRVRFGIVGRILDRLVFRPLMGWATAWSFDRLRLWIERDISPENSAHKSMIHGLARISAAFVWIYHGLVPKLLFRSPDEVRMMVGSGIPESALRTCVTLAGWLEIAIGLSVLVFWKPRWPLLITIILMVLALLGVAINSPSYLVGAFNPVTLNLLVISTCVIGLLAGSKLPAAANCRRKPPTS